MPIKITLQDVCAGMNEPHMLHVTGMNLGGMTILDQGCFSLADALTTALRNANRFDVISISEKAIPEHFDFTRIGHLVEDVKSIVALMDRDGTITMSRW